MSTSLSLRWREPRRLTKFWVNGCVCVHVCCNPFVVSLSARWQGYRISSGHVNMHVHLWHSAVTRCDFSFTLLSLLLLLRASSLSLYHTVSGVNAMSCNAHTWVVVRAVILPFIHSFLYLIPAANDYCIFYYSEQKMEPKSTIAPKSSRQYKSKQCSPQGISHANMKMMTDIIW